MASDRTLPAYTNVEVLCPLCKRISTQKRLKPHVFTERERDVDLRPKTFHRSIPRVEMAHPPLFYMWHCVNCHFVASNALYEEAFKSFGATADRIRERLAGALTDEPAASAIQERLVRFLRDDPLDHFQAVVLTLLAIHQLKVLQGMANVDPLDLGRYYLRLAWLFADIEENPTLGGSCATLLSDLFAVVSVYWSGVPSNASAARGCAAECYNEALGSSYSIASAKDEIDLLLLLCGIQIKLNSVREAKKNLSLARERARKWDNEVELKARKPEGDPGALNDNEKISMRAECKRLTNACNEMQRRFEIFVDDWEAKDEAKARLVLARHPDSSREEQLQILKEAGIEDAVARRVAVPDKGKKKGLFS